MLQFLASSNETRGTSDIWRKAWGEVTNYDKLFSGMTWLSAGSFFVVVSNISRYTIFIMCRMYALKIDQKLLLMYVADLNVNFVNCNLHIEMIHLLSTGFWSYFAEYSRYTANS